MTIVRKPFTARLIPSLLPTTKSRYRIQLFSFLLSLSYLSSLFFTSFDLILLLSNQLSLYTFFQFLLYQILFKTPGLHTRIIGRSVSFTAPSDLVVQCDAFILKDGSRSTTKRAILVVKGLPPVRLSGGAQPNEGVLEVLQNRGHWRAVCKDAFQQLKGKLNATHHCASDG